MSKVNDLAGRRFGRFIVLARAGSNGERKAMWRCICICGNERLICGRSLLTGNSNSCGCLRSEVLKRIKKTHGLTRSATYRTWGAMLQRCGNPKNPYYHVYGARGIAVCDRWKSFISFFRDMGERPNGLTLDRIDTEGNYEPSNCRWATVREQANNMRKNVFIEAFGERLTISQWARKSGQFESGIRYRLRSGWSPERAVVK